MSSSHRGVLWSQHRWVHIFTLPAQCHMRRPCSWIQLCLFTRFYRSAFAHCENGCGVFLHTNHQQLQQWLMKWMSLITATDESRVLDPQALVSCHPHGSLDSRFPSWMLFWLTFCEAYSWYKPVLHIIEHKITYQHLFWILIAPQLERPQQSLLLPPCLLLCHQYSQKIPTLFINYSTLLKKTLQALFGTKSAAVKSSAFTCWDGCTHWRLLLFLPRTKVAQD